jgi:hypothetical protein
MWRQFVTDVWLWHDQIAWAANLVLGLVGVVGIVVAIRTLRSIQRQVREMRLQRNVMRRTLTAISRQAELMEKQSGILAESVAVARTAADVAQRSMDAMISKERARIQIEVDDLYSRGMPYVQFFVHCHGSTEAFITLARAMAIVTESLDRPDWLPIFPMGLPITLKATKTEASVRIANKMEISSEDYASIDAGRLFVHFYGTVEYTDVFDQVRETAFSYVLKATDLKNSDGAMVRYWIKNGPPEANRET